jgi:hypothetical protein
MPTYGNITKTDGKIVTSSIDINPSASLDEDIKMVVNPMKMRLIYF